MNLFKLFMSLLQAGSDNASIRPRAAEFSLPFNPPLNTPIVYDHQRRVERQGQVQTIYSTEQFIWSAAPNGYFLQWNTTAFEFQSAEPMQSLMNGIGHAMLATPMLIAVTPEGAIADLVDLKNWRRLNRAALIGIKDRVPALFADQSGASHAAIATMIDGMITQIDGQTDAQFADSQLQSLRLLLCEAGPLPAGEELVVTAQLPSLIGDRLVRTELMARLELNPSGTWARLRISSASDPEETAAAAAPVVAAALEAIADPEIRREAQANVAALPLPEATDELVQLFELPSGLAKRCDYRRTIKIAGMSPRLETRRFRRLD